MEDDHKEPECRGFSNEREFRNRTTDEDPSWVLFRPRCTPVKCSKSFPSLLFPSLGKNYITILSPFFLNDETSRLDF